MWASKSPNLHALVGVNPCTKAICIFVWVGHKTRVSEQVSMGHLQCAQTDELHLNIHGKHEHVSSWSSKRENDVQYDQWLVNAEIGTRKVKAFQAFISLLFPQELLQHDGLIYLWLIYTLTPFFYP